MVLSHALISTFLLVGESHSNADIKAWGPATFEAPIESIRLERDFLSGRESLAVETKLKSRCYSLGASMFKRSREQKVVMIYVEALNRADAGFDCDQSAKTNDKTLVQNFELGDLKPGTYQILDYKTLKKYSSIEISPPDANIVISDVLSLDHATASLDVKKSSKKSL